MSKAAELIADLQSNADFDSDGGFTLDRDKAREKMRQFQLADPHRYVLLLVEAAALRGATKISFEIDSDDMRMHCDAALEWADLDELYASLFVDRTSVAIRARRELALACNAVMALNPRFCKLESAGVDAHSGERYGVAALLRSEVDDELSRFEPPPDCAPYTSVHVKERFRPGLMVRFVRDIQGQLPEEMMIASRCRHASIEINLDGQRISAGLPTDLLAAVRFEGEGLVGLAGLVPDAQRRRRSVMVLLSNGVEIATHELSGSVGGLWFWVDCSRFRKDVSQADVVRNDPVYTHMLECVGMARDRVLGRLAELWADGSFFTAQTQPSASNVFDLLRACFLRWADTSWLAPNAGPLGRLAQLRLWRMLDGESLSPLELVERLGEHGVLGYSTESFDGVLPSGWDPVVFVTGGELELEALARIYPDASDVTARLAREVPWELNRRAWRARPWEVSLDSHGGRQVSFSDGEIRGVLRLKSGGLSDVRVVVDGCLLAELELDLGLGHASLLAVITGELDAASDYTHPKYTRSYAQVLLALLAALPAALEQVASEHPSLVKGVLVALTRPNFAREWLETFGFGTAAASRLMSRLGAPQLLPSLGLLEGASASAVAQATRLRRVDGEELNLVDIERERHAREQHRGQIPWVGRHVTLATTGSSSMPYLYLDEHELRLLRALFGGAALRDESEAFALVVERERFMAQPQRELPEPQTTWVKRVELSQGEAGRITGYVGVDGGELRRWKPNTPRRMSIELYVHKRRLCLLHLPSWIPGVEAVLCWDQAPVNASYAGLEDGEDSLREAVELALVQLLLERSEAALSQRPGDEERRLLWMGLVTPFVCAELYTAYRAIRAHFGERQAEAAQAQFELMTLYPGIALDDMRGAIRLLIEAGTLPSRAAVVELAGREPKREEGGREFHRQLLTHYPALERSALISTTSGASVSLATMSEEFEREANIAYVREPGLRWEGERIIMRADRIDQVALIRLFGKHALEEVSAWIHEQAHQRAFEARAQLEQLRVPEHQRLVGVELQQDGFRGELAIPNWSAGEGSSVKLTFCHDRRVVEELELHAPLPVIAIVDDPDAELNEDFSAVVISSRRMAQLRAYLGDVLVDELLPKLAEAYPTLDARQQSLARSWMFSHWRRKSPRAGQHPNRLDAPGRAFAALPLFRDTDGEARSLDQLIARAEQLDTLWYVERHPGPAIELPFPIVEARAEFLDILERLFPRLEDFSGRWAARVQGDRRKAKAPALPPLEVPAEALVEVSFERHELEGVMWLMPAYPNESGIAAGVQGKLVESLVPVPSLPARGVATGALRVDDAFERVQLTSPQRMFLRARVIYLYSMLLNQHRRDLDRPDRPDFMEPAAVTLRQQRLAHLRGAAVALAQARLRKQSFDAILGNLERRLEAEPLLRMSSGRLISTDLARQVRPVEFRHLEIWDPDLPPLDPSERARLLLGEPPAPKSKPKAPVVEEVDVAEAAETDSPSESTDVAESSAASDASDNQGAGAAATTAPPVEPGQSEPEQSEPEPTPMDVAALGRVEPADDEQGVSEPVNIDGIITQMQEQQVMANPAEVLLERIRAELRLLRDTHEVVLADGLLDKICAEERGGKMLVVIDRGVYFDAKHPSFVRAMEDPDPVWVSFLASTAYTALNTWLEAITDEHEVMFHDAHARLLLGTMLEEA